MLTVVSGSSKSDNVLIVDKASGDEWSFLGADSSKELGAGVNGKVDLVKDPDDGKFYARKQCLAHTKQTVSQFSLNVGLLCEACASQDKEASLRDHENIEGGIPVHEGFEFVSQTMTVR